MQDKKIHIAEIFESIQSEGSQAGMPALFIRLAGCNLWSGLEESRHSGKGECAVWCDTDFLKKQSLSIAEISNIVSDYTRKSKNPLIVFTGGEPSLQIKFLEIKIKDWLQNKIYISIETNGTRRLDIIEYLYDHHYGHVVCSPKRMKNSELYDNIQLKRCNDLKLVYPFIFDDIPLEYDNLFIQPLDSGDSGVGLINEVILTARKRGARVSIQQHKFLGLK